MQIEKIRNKVFRFRINSEEEEAFKELAKMKNTNRSALIRNYLFIHPKCESLFSLEEHEFPRAGHNIEK